MARTKIIRHTDLEAYQKAFATSMEIFELTKAFPREEIFALMDQIRRSSRSVCANLAETWRKRRYAGAFVLKLNDSESEAAETQSWLEYSVGCGYLEKQKARELYKRYDEILGPLVGMINHPETWVITKKRAD